MIILSDYNQQILQFLADKNKTAQDIFVLEEMSELQKELMKHRRGKDNRNEIIDECVDVILTLNVLLRAYNATEVEVTNLINYKLNRLRDFLPMNEMEKSETDGVEMGINKPTTRLGKHGILSTDHGIILLCNDTNQNQEDK